MKFRSFYTLLELLILIFLQIEKQQVETTEFFPKTFLLISTAVPQLRLIPFLKLILVQSKINYQMPSLGRKSESCTHFMALLDFAHLNKLKHNFFLCKKLPFATKVLNSKTNSISRKKTFCLFSDASWKCDVR